MLGVVSKESVNLFLWVPWKEKKVDSGGATLGFLGLFFV